MALVGFLASVTVEGIAIGLALRGTAWAILALALHAGAAGLAARALGGRSPARRFLALTLVLALPGLGLAGLGAVHAWSWFSPPSTEAISDHATLESLPSPERAGAQLEAVLEWVHAQVSVQPLADAIRSEDPDRQRWAIQLLSRRDDGQAVDMLREGLLSAHRDTQIASAGAILRVEERLDTRAHRARAAVAQAPGSALAWSTLGDACRAYRESHLLEAPLERQWLDEAEQAYRRALDIEPGSRPVRLALARVLVALGRAVEAEPLARSLTVEGPPALDPGGEADLLLAESLALQGRWPEVRESCRAALASGREGDLIAWWGRDRDG
jgi:tetratricopeptide (TPR) repeat protein